MTTLDSSFHLPPLVRPNEASMGRAISDACDKLEGIVGRTMANVARCFARAAVPASIPVVSRPTPMSPISQALAEWRATPLAPIYDDYPDAAEGIREARKVASEQILDAWERGSQSLTLTGLDTIPDCIGLLTELKVLKFDQCQFRNLPNSVGNLSKLEELRITSNPYARLEAGLSSLVHRLPSLEILVLPVTFCARSSIQHQSNEQCDRANLGRLFEADLVDIGHLRQSRISPPLRVPTRSRMVEYRRAQTEAVPMPSTPYSPSGAGASFRHVPHPPRRDTADSSLPDISSHKRMRRERSEGLGSAPSVTNTNRGLQAGGVW